MQEIEALKTIKLLYAVMITVVVPPVPNFIVFKGLSKGEIYYLKGADSKFSFLNIVYIVVNLQHVQILIAFLNSHYCQLHYNPSWWSIYTCRYCNLLLSWIFSLKLAGVPVLNCHMVRLNNGNKPSPRASTLPSLALTGSILL